MTEAEKCVEDVRRIHRLLKEETGLHTIASADKQVDGELFFVVYFLLYSLEQIYLTIYNTLNAVHCFFPACISAISIGEC